MVLPNQIPALEDRLAHLDAQGFGLGGSGNHTAIII
jgi:hypothetical protein